MDQQKLNEYARLIVQMGIRPAKGQEVIIMAGLDQIEFVRLVAEMCYKAGASKVQVDWQDMPINKLA
ncbi:MAG: aminopeptidase, partial [Lentisphaeria bacterium]|nr:aminopeptidase [Lentisphaeria bacterium]